MKYLAVPGTESCRKVYMCVYMSSLPPLPVRALRWRASPHPSPSSYSVMCWNMLAQCYTRSEYFPSVSPKSALKWKHRGPAIVAEVQRLAPDVIALQEVDNWDFMSSELGSAGYDGVRKGKTGGKKDGVAVLWKRALLRLAESEEVETDIKGGVGLLVRLEPASAASDGGGSFVVATTHLFWNPQLEVLKLRQAELCLRRAAAFARGAQWPISRGCAVRCPLSRTGRRFRRPARVLRRPQLDAGLGRARAVRGRSGREAHLHPDARGRRRGERRV